MKFKKLLISASIAAAGSGLLATVLTSCAKANVDEKLKINLDDNGLLYDLGNMGKEYKITFADAIESALSRSSNWGQFKSALADEIVFKWFTDRMSPSKDSSEKNTSFRTSYDEWEYQINKDYKELVQNCKNKHGANWQFYLQNEYLAPLGGTEAAYKHAKLVEKIRADFISKVFAKNYFSMPKGDLTTGAYRHIYQKATKDIDKNDVRNEKNWSKIGFYASSELSFVPGEDPVNDYAKVDADYLARHPDGDYAAIQDYVFNRWFKTEKPFFSAAALFKYSNPKYVASAKLDQVYEATRTGVKVPTDKPSEAFPFFGAGETSSTRKVVDFLTHLAAGQFATPYYDGLTEHTTNGTITIPKDDTDDGQTLLLCYGNQMFGGANALYIPYAMAAGNLYLQMMGSSVTSPNSLTSKQVNDNINNNYKRGVLDDFAILSNFFYTADPKPAQQADPGIHNRLDLNTVYGGESGGEYHCPLFKECKDYPFFYGDTTKTGTAKNGIRYITNNIQVNDFASEKTGYTDAQPWVMELNEAGMHIQTIDGFNYVKNAGAGKQQEALKEVVKYRLMQKQITDDAAGVISADLLGESGKLKSYFSDNFTNIVLELATAFEWGSTATEIEKYSVFRPIASYKVQTQKQDQLFLYSIWTEQKLGAADKYTNIIDYLDKVLGYELLKKNFDAIETANNKIYAYRSKQISNSKSDESFGKTIFENGLLAPIVYAPVSNTANSWTHDYESVNRVIDLDVSIGTTSVIDQLSDKLDAIQGSELVKAAKAATVNDENFGFSPQIKAAKDATSNRFWYKSAIVDKIMYSYMGNKANTANAIKMNAYDYYGIKNGSAEWFSFDQYSKFWGETSTRDAFATTYAKNKLITTDKTLAEYSTNKDLTITGYYNLMYTSYFNYLAKNYVNGGIYNDENASIELFKATIMYLVANNFQNFYKVFDSKIAEDEVAISAYMAKGYLADMTTTEYDPSAQESDYSFATNVDNIFDKTGMSGKDAEATIENSKLSTTNQWVAVNKKFGSNTNPLAGYLGLQTKSSNQLDTGSSMQTEVFGTLSKTIVGSKHLGTEDLPYEQNSGCWFQFAGAKSNKDDLINIKEVSYGGETFNSASFSDYSAEGGKNYTPVRKLAKKIIECNSTDDLRNIAKLLANSYDGYSYFTPIASGERSFLSIPQMQVEMLKLLPSKNAEGKSWNSAELKCFSRVVDAEAHTTDVTQSRVFKNTKAQTGHKIILTQLNKADIVEQRLHPTYDENRAEGSRWVQGSSPLTPEEFWVILCNLAAESSVQQKCVNEVVATAFGDKKLIVYDAQLYNQFDSVWIKDWTKKTIGA